MQINGFSYTSLTTTPSNTAGASSVGANLGNANAGANSVNEQSVAQDSCQLSAKANADSASGIGKAEPGQDIRRLRILHLNDLHGAALPEEGRGGLAQVAAVVKREKAEVPEGSLVLNAGDIAEGTMISYLSKGNIVSESLAQMGCDAIEPGNHDFAWGQPVMRSMLGQVNAPIVCANLEQAEGHEFSQPYIIREVNGVKVGILGLSTDVSNLLSQRMRQVGSNPRRLFAPSYGSSHWFGQRS